jgi:hypothetical protein
MGKRAKLKRSQLHGCWRAKQKKAMIGAIDSRSLRFKSGAQRLAIVSWLNRDKRSSPIRTIYTQDTGTVTEPTRLKQIADAAFKKRSLGGHGATNWYEDHPIDTAKKEGEAIRITLVEECTSKINTEGVPNYLEHVLEEGQYKELDKF